MYRNKGYDRITFIYDFIAGLLSLNRINKSQLTFVSQLSDASTCLILGGGTGYFLQKLLIQNKAIHITYVDSSERMIAAAQKRIQQQIPAAFDRVRFVCIDVINFEWQYYDLIVCNYFLDLFDTVHVDALGLRFKKQLNPNGFLYITDFDIPKTNGLIKWCTETGLKILYYIHRRVTTIKTYELPEIEKSMKAQGFAVLHSKKYLKGILKCVLYKTDS